ncbi:MAG: hypothetical protein ACRBCI_14295 [Cellvibrionaceae bacterium]
MAVRTVCFWWLKSVSFMWHRSAWPIWLIKALIIALVLGYQQYISDNVSVELSELTSVLGAGHVLFWGLLVYAVLLALPYFPSVEIGFAIMVVFGKQGVAFAYVATLIGFLLAFLVGKLIQNFDLKDHGLYRVCKSDITAKLAGKSPFFALVMLINLPGNIVLGGGGGIALNYGMTKQLNILMFTLAIAIGVAPLPLLMVLGYSF